MSNIAIKIENLSKLYRLGKIGTGTLSHDLNRFIAKLKGKEDPYSIVGQINDRAAEATSDYVWALKDINFEVQQGEVLGIIGKNGAGKSTLLKIISQITSPTTGVIKAKGRIASLLEVGTGMHPEMTARENIFLNGAIMGMTKKEIKAKFDEIIEFSGCSMYVDTPVKRFSSGMRVRLGFAVAAFMEPEILIVDEVLAVGDAEFQKKAIGKMKDVSKGSGRTVLFVSHNMAAVKSLCSRAIVLENGAITFDNEVDSAVEYYLKGEKGTSVSHKLFKEKEVGINGFCINEIGVKAKNRTIEDTISCDDELEVIIQYTYSKKINARLDFNLLFKGEDGIYIFNSSTGHMDETLIKEGEHKLCMTIPAHFFSFGTYFMDIMLVQDHKIVPFTENDILSFTINPESSKLGNWMGKGKTYLKPRFSWEKL